MSMIKIERRAHEVEEGGIYGPLKRELILGL